MAQSVFPKGSMPVEISRLSPNLYNAVVSGIVIAKQDCRVVQSKKKPGKEHYVLGFTIRDSPNDSINVTCWGDDSSVRNLSDKFQIMDTVQIRNPQIQLKHSASSDNRYRPDISSPFHLNISATHSELDLFPQVQQKFSHLIHIPTKPSNQFHTLADIIYNGQEIDGEHVNILVAVKSIGVPQNITTKDGRNLRKLEITVFDQTHSSFIIFIWEEAVINFAEKWNPMKCVLFVNDIKVNFNRHLKGMAATVDGLTVLTPNPETHEAYSLYQYAQTVDFGTDVGNDCNINFGGPIYLIEEVQKMLTMGCDISLSGDIQGVIHGVITKLDLDGSSRISSIRCKRCKQRIQSQEGRCLNVNCTMGNGTEITVTQEIFDINMWLSDHTGTLNRCFLSGEGAQKLLNCSVDEFSYLTDIERTNLKWQFLLEHCKVSFKEERRNCKGDKLSKERVTLFLCGNMEGEVEEPLVIRKVLKPRCFKNMDVNKLPVICHVNSNSWMTAELMEK